MSADAARPRAGPSGRRPTPTATAGSATPAAAAVARRFYVDGQPVATDFTDRCITITTGQLRTVDGVIAVGGGQGKTAAFRAVLNGGYATNVVTDVLVARGLLDQPHPEPRPGVPQPAEVDGSVPAAAQRGPQ